MNSRTPKSDLKRPRATGKVVPLRPGRMAAPKTPDQGMDPRQVEQAFGTMAARISAADDITEAHRQQLGVIQTLLGARAAFVVRHVPDKNQLQVTTVRGR